MRLPLRRGSAPWLARRAVIGVAEARCAEPFGTVFYLVEDGPGQAFLARPAQYGALLEIPIDLLVDLDHLAHVLELLEIVSVRTRNTIAVNLDSHAELLHFEIKLIIKCGTP